MSHARNDLSPLESGGDDGARTRGLCRDRSAFDRSPLNPWALMANKSTVSPLKALQEILPHPRRPLLFWAKPLPPHGRGRKMWTCAAGQQRSRSSQILFFYLFGVPLITFFVQTRFQKQFDQGIVELGSAVASLSSYHSARADLNPQKRLSVYPGSERFPLDDRTDAIGVVELAEALQSFT